jgi:hypothetical protein
MNQLREAVAAERKRNFLYLTTPSIWPVWPYLPLLRNRPGCEQEYGVLCDFLHVSGRTGYSATVFIANLFLMPRDEAEIIQLPREVYDTAEDIYAAGWRVDGDC